MAWDLYGKGWTEALIAEALDVTPGAISQWIKIGKNEGVEGLARKKATGAPSKLNSDQIEQPFQILENGAESYGFQGELWTCPRVVEVIKKEFDVTYHPDHINRLLKAHGWSSQKPKKRALQRDETEIQQWKEETWPAIKKSP